MPDKEPAHDSAILFGHLSRKLRESPPEVQQRIVGHIREVSGHHSLPAYATNGATEADKTALYRECLLAILQADFSKLKGQVAACQAKSAEPPAKVEPTEDKPKTRIPPRQKPQELPAGRLDVKTPPDASNEAPGTPPSLPAPPVTPEIKVTSYRVGCKTKGDTNWAYNGVRFETQVEADRYGKDLFSRWTALESWEVQGCDEPVSCKWTSEGVKFLEPTPPKPSEPSEQPPTPAPTPEPSAETPSEVSEVPDKPSAPPDEAAIRLLFEQFSANERMEIRRYVDQQIAEAVHAAKFDLLRVMHKAYDKNRQDLADKVASAIAG